MIPSRFATEYPTRCLELLKLLEPIARGRDLVGSFSVMLASSVLIVPWERADSRHPLAQEHGGDLEANLRAMREKKWLAAPFWQGAMPGEWRFSRIMGDPNNVRLWADEEGRPSFSGAANTMSKRKVNEVFRVLRNAFAHGNIIYLDGQGLETAGARVEHIAFLSKYEEKMEQRAEAETYRLVTVREADFLPFVRAWASWVSRRHASDDLRAA